jgi:hypothetical protein
MRNPLLSRMHLVSAFTLALIALELFSQQAVIAQRTARAPASADPILLPLREGSARFVVIGDTGTGGGDQQRLSERLITARQKFPYEFILLTGDNLYGSEKPKDYVNKFERPYKALLDAGVKFYASLGNHDDTNQILYKPFNMNGKRFYTFKPKPDLRFFALDSNYMSPEQLTWLEKELSASSSEWKIVFFHHPIYSTGERHGSDLRLREQLEPRFVKHGVDVVFTGHEHFYERLKPQNGVHYFISGGGAKLRKGGIEGGPVHETGFDQGFHFMLIEVAADVMHFQVISDLGKTVDSGTITRRPNPGAAPPKAGTNSKP